jgi:RNA polymerase sigma-70 factor, ECF subfamily
VQRMEQAELIQRIHNGDDSAFAELMNPLIEKGYRTSYGIVKSKEQAEEVVQNAMIEAYRNIMGGKEITYFGTWFYKLVSHRSIDVLRKNGRLKETVIEMDYIKDKRGVLDRVIKDETENEIKQGIKSLENQDYRNVLLLYYYQEFSIQEVSEMLGLNASTVKSHLRRARNALKTRLMENQIIGVNS